MTKKSAAEKMIKRRPLPPELPSKPQDVKHHNIEMLAKIVIDCLQDVPAEQLVERYHVNLPVARQFVREFKKGFGSGLTGQVAIVDPTRMWGNNKVPAYNPNGLITRKGMRMLDKMRTDDQIKAALMFKKLASMQSGWEVVPPSESDKEDEVTTFVDGQLQDVPGGFKSIMLEALSALDYGFSVGEILWYEIPAGKDAGKLGLQGVRSLYPHYISFAPDEYGNLGDDGIIQTSVYGGGGFDGAGGKRLPVNKMLLFTYQMEFSNYYGRTDLEAAYTPWWVKTNAYRWLAMLLERFGIPPIFAMYDPRMLTKAQIEALVGVVKGIQAATAGAIPRNGKDSLEMWAPELGNQTNSVFVPALDMLNRDIARALLMPGLLGFTADQGAGSLARSQTHFDAFLLIIDMLRGQLEETVQTKIVAPLVDYNYADVEPDQYPQFRFLPLHDEVKTELFDAWGKMLDRGAVKHQESDEAHIRASLDFPEVDDSDPMRDEPLPQKGPPGGPGDGNPNDPNAPDGGNQPDGGNSPPPPQPKPDEAATRAGLPTIHLTRRRHQNRHPDSRAADDAEVKRAAEEVRKLQTSFEARAAAIKNNRQSNSFERYVDFTVIKSDLDTAQSRAMAKLIPVFRTSRSRTLTYVQRNFKNDMRFVRKFAGVLGLAPAKPIYFDFLTGLFDKGQTAARGELSKAKKNLAQAFASKPLFKPTDAIAYLRARSNFFVSDIDDALTKQTKQVLLDALDAGTAIHNVIKQLSDMYEPYVGNPNVIRNGDVVQPWRLETIVRTNFTDAYNRGRIIASRDAGDLLEAWEFSAVIDDVTTDVCRYLDGKLFARGDDNFETLVPPLHYNCRSVIVPVVSGDEINEDDYITEEEAGTARDLAQFVLGDHARAHHYHYRVDEFINPNHEPAGSDKGGQFAPAGSDAVSWYEKMMDARPNKSPPPSAYKGSTYYSPYRPVLSTAPFLKEHNGELVSGTTNFVSFPNPISPDVAARAELVPFSSSARVQMLKDIYAGTDGASPGTYELGRYGDGGENAVLIAPSVKSDGYQLTTATVAGFSGDMQFSSSDEALKEALSMGFNRPAPGLIDTLADNPEFKANEQFGHAARKFVINAMRNFDVGGTYSACFLTMESAQRLHDWAVEQGVPNVIPPGEMHVTIHHAKVHGIGSENDYRPLAANTTISNYDGLKSFGLDGEALVLLLDQDDAAPFVEQNAKALAAGAQPTNPEWEYTPHVTLSYDAPGFRLKAVPDFAIEFGPEAYGQVDAQLQRNFMNPNHEPAGSDKGGQFAPADGGGGASDKDPASTPRGQASGSQPRNGFGETDESLAKHIADPDVRREVLEKMAVSDALPRTNTIDTPEREVLRQSIVDKLYGNGAAVKGREAWIVTGVPAAGKNAISDPILKETGSLLVDSDEAKKGIPEYHGGLGAGAVHIESSDIITPRLLVRAVENGDNIVMPRVGKSYSGLAQDINYLKSQGYKVNLVYVDVNTNEAIKRGIARYQSQGRLVSVSYMESVNGHPKESFERARKENIADAYQYWDNNGPKGSSKRLYRKKK